MLALGGRRARGDRRGGWEADPRTTRLRRQIARLKRALVAHDAVTTSLEPKSPDALSSCWPMQLKEIEHRAKNSLQLAATMLLVQGKYVGDPILRGHLEAAAFRLTSLSGLHAALHETAWADGVPLRSWIQRVCDGLPKGPGVTIDIVAPDGPWPVELARPIGLFAFEAVANALEHGFRNRETGRIVVSLTTGPDGHCLQVLDDGHGAVAQPTPGLGMTLCRLFADQVGGVLTTDFSEQGGFRTRIDFEAATLPVS